MHHTHKVLLNYERYRSIVEARRIQASPHLHLAQVSDLLIKLSGSHSHLSNDRGSSSSAPALRDNGESGHDNNNVSFDYPNTELIEGYAGDEGSEDELGEDDEDDVEIYALKTLFRKRQKREVRQREIREMAGEDVEEEELEGSENDLFEIPSMLSEREVDRVARDYWVLRYSKIHGFSRIFDAKKAMRHQMGQIKQFGGVIDNLGVGEMDR